ncbi:conserved hypothetical protein [Ferroglobus placidus DSM 10642]|uniref:HTH marR-type domain-containing protein n=1 Tax=Ferroglobus placidus (strain DSM 10642 / AEDII12DO) TaxID=589924 RepID=D3S086_FERPA|nr:MarR family transcriptional regulator [Ferroglobus placidus]ADC66149.1 conserved hypothetical protein [Ferroglobus placidus DSM 10642]
MKVAEKILDELRKSKERGLLQSELVRRIGASKSTVSDVLSELEGKGIVVREKEAGKSLRVWLAEFYPKPIKGKLKLGILKSSEYACLLSRFRGIVRVYNNAMDLTRDLVLGRIDLAASPFVTQVMFGVMMKNIRIVRGVAYNGSGVVFGDEKNGIFGSSELSAMEIMLRLVKDEIGLKKFRYFSSPEEMISSLKYLNGIGIWEPYFSSLDRDKVFFKDIIGDHPCCTLAVNVESFEENKSLIKDFLADYDKAKPNAEKLAEICGFSKEDVEKSLKSYIFVKEVREDELIDFLKLAKIEISRESLESLFELQNV